MKRIWHGVLLWMLTLPGGAANLDLIGVSLLRTIDPSLKGTGVMVTQPEAGGGSNPPAFEVNPAAVGQPVGLFTYTSSLGSSPNFPNSVGSESGHANGVGAVFYGLSTGVAPEVAHVDNYDADYFYNTVITLLGASSGKIVNQSFIFNSLTIADQQRADARFDNYASQYQVLFISGTGNGGASGNDGFINPPATAYNGIGVGVVDGSTSIGPTRDNGRSKPDLTAPGGSTSISTPYVSGSAALLIQAGRRGDGGAATNEATDIRTVKALLLNGAIKPANWTNGSATPLDARYGAGIVNVFNSYQQLKGGRHAFMESTLDTAGGSHPPGASTNNLSSLTGWDLNTLTSPSNQDRINHYYFNLTAAQGGPFTLTATLVWNRQTASPVLPQPNLNNLDFFLVDASNGNPVASSTSGVDNVEHIFRAVLPAGRYDLQVVKRGSANQQSASETYALAFEIFALPLNLVHSPGEVTLAWPISPTGFTLQSTPNLASPIAWNDVNGSITVTNNENRMTLSGPATNQFYRLKRP
jgi:hypothetical protein